MPREKEQKAYTFSQTLRSQIRGLNIVSVRAVTSTPGCLWQRCGHGGGLVRLALMEMTMDGFFLLVDVDAFDCGSVPFPSACSRQDGHL